VDGLTKISQHVTGSISAQVEVKTVKTLLDVQTVPHNKTVPGVYQLTRVRMVIIMVTDLISVTAMILVLVLQPVKMYHASNVSGQIPVVVDVKLVICFIILFLKYTSHHQNSPLLY